MANSDSIQALWSSITTVRKGLDALEAALVTILQDAALGQTVRAALADSNAGKQAVLAVTRAKADATPPSELSKGKRGRRPGRVVGNAAVKGVEKILTALEGKEKGLSAKELNQATGLRAEALSYRLGVLRKEKKVRMEGQRSSARYFLAF
jgi:hypothetical protein